MKKIILFFSVVSFAFLMGIARADSSFSKNLYFGIQKDSEVTKLQEFLTSEGLYSGPITGNFFSLTLKAVKDFQNREGISPAAGYFGPLTRARANQTLDVQIQGSDAQAIAETGTTTVPIILPKTTNDVVASLQAQIDLLTKQLALIQQQQSSVAAIQQNTQQTQITLQQIQQNTQQIQQNTTPSLPSSPPSPPPTPGPGTLTFGKDSNSATSPVLPGAGVELAKFYTKLTNENMEIRQISFYIDQTPGGTALRNFVIKINSTIVFNSYGAGSSFVMPTTPTTITLQSYPVLLANQSHYITIEAGISGDALSTDVYTIKQMNLIQVKRLTTNDLYAPTTSPVDGNQISVKAQALTVTTLSQPAASMVAIGAIGYEFATFQLDAQASGEDLKISKIVITHSGGEASEIGNLYLYKDNDSSPLSVNNSTATNGPTVTFNLNTITVTRAIPVTLHLKADALSGSGSHTFNIMPTSAGMMVMGLTTGNSIQPSQFTFVGSGKTVTIVP